MLGSLCPYCPFLGRIKVPPLSPHLPTVSTEEKRGFGKNSHRDRVLVLPIANALCALREVDTGEPRFWGP